MVISFYIISAVAIIGAILAVSLRNLIHCALAAALFFLATAAMFFLLKAEFIGVVQILIYIGAIATLLLFTIMLTRHPTGADPYTGKAKNMLFSLITSVGMASILAGSVLSQTGLPEQVRHDIHPSVAEIGTSLLTTFLLPFEVISLLLTAAMIGGIVLAIEKKRKSA